MTRQRELEILIKDLKRSIVTLAEDAKSTKHEPRNSYLECMFETVDQLRIFTNEYNELQS